MTDWKKVTHPAILRIERVASLFEIWPSGVNMGTVKIKILEVPEGGYHGTVDTAIVNKQTQELLWAYGNGTTVVEALEKTLEQLFDFIQTHRNGDEIDIVWANERQF